MTLEERIELAGADIWTHLATDYTSREVAEAAIRAAFPELFTDPPTAWIAPWEASDAMRSRGGAEIGYYDPEYEVASEIAREVFRAFRDSHLSTLKGKKPE